MAFEPDKLDFEDRCKSIFDEHLRSHYAFRNIAWEKHPNGRSSPPDFYLTINNKFVSVEITGLPKMREDEDEQISDETYKRSRMELVYALEDMALELGVLRGRYVVTFPMHWMVSLSRARGHIEKYVLDYVQNSGDKESEKNSVIFFEDKPVCVIYKLDKMQNRIAPVFMDREWTDSLENVPGAHEMVKRAILDKIQKLRNQNIPRPWVLVLCNTYPFVSEKSFRTCESQELIKGKRAFDWIFIITSQISGFDFYLKRRSFDLL
jgi:hypothetical protein